MTSNRDREGISSTKTDGWPNRLLTLAAAGILFLTLYPFEIGHAKWHGNGSVLFLGHGAKASGALDISLNILLFCPFGFALGTELLRSGKSRKAALVYTTLAGGLLSYGIELTQLYIPARDSGWTDVITNTTGSVVGWIAAVLLGSWVSRLLSEGQEYLRAWLTPRWLASVLLIYFGIWFVASAFLQKEVSLDDWRTDCLLVFRNDATGRNPWPGKLLQVQIWDRALPNSFAEALTSAPEAASVDDPVVNLNFGENTAAGDQNPQSRHALAANSGAIPQSSSVQQKTAVDVADRLKQAGQFSIRAVLAPADAAQPSGRILALSQQSGFTDLYLNQENESLIFWFRTPVSSRWRSLGWKIPNALLTDRTRTVLFSYDGSALRCYMDGNEIQSHAMGAGTALAGKVRHVKGAELKGYRMIYYALIFFPAGALLGMATPSAFWRRASVIAIIVSAVLLAPASLEWILMRTSKGPFSPANVTLSVVLVLLGFLWMKTGGVLRAPGETSSLARQSPMEP